MNIQKIALISCSKKKTSFPAQAKELYSPSPLFKKASSYINQRYSVWFILSAKYGLLTPGEYIEPYDLSIETMSSRERLEWASVIYEKLKLEIEKYESVRIDFYAGEKYRKFLINILQNQNIKVEEPMRGLGIGEQLRFYNMNQK